MALTIRHPFNFNGLSLHKINLNSEHWNDEHEISGWPDPETTVCYASVSLSAAQLLDLYNTPVEIVAAPGAGKIIVPQGKISVVFTPVTTPYYHISTLGLKWAGTDVKRGLLNTDRVLNKTLPTWHFITIQDFDGGPHVVTNVALQVYVDVNLVGGLLLTGSINNAGVDYVPGDTINFNDDVLTVDTVDGLGAVTGVTITDHGTSNVPATGVATGTSGAGVGFTYNVLTATVGDGTAVVTVPYQVINAPVGTQFNFPD